MKRSTVLFTALAVSALIVGACGAQTPLVVVVTATPPPPTEPPAGGASATEAAVLPIDLAGPPMEVGSKYVYIDGAVLVAVPGGPFVMGYSYADNPEREVSVSDFWIYSSEVTNRQYALCVGAGKCAAPDQKDNPQYGNYRFVNFPVVGVDHRQAASYCEFVHGRLPTEAEWEKAARGPEGSIFPWGNSGPTCDLLNYNFCEGKTTEIQTYPEGVSYYGLFDMAGNVREWVADWYSNEWFKTFAGEDPLGPELGDRRSVRSSAFSESADSAISAKRSSLDPEGHTGDLGFRCVVEDITYFAPMCVTQAFYGSGPLGTGEACTPDPQCNDVNLNVAVPNCYHGNVPGSNYVNVQASLSDTPPNGWTVDPGGCEEVGVNQYTCIQIEGDGPVTATGSCEISGGCTLSCAPPEYYDLVDGTCKWNGSGVIGTECPAGTTFDAALNCCSAVPGSGWDTVLCPDGMSPYGDGCVYGDFFVDTASVDPGDWYTGNLCGSPDDPDDDGDDDGGQCTPINCTGAAGNYFFCPSLCACVSSANACP